VSGFHLDKNKSDVTIYMGVNDNLALVFKTTVHDLRYGK
jgi:hypothetical protein